MKGDITQYRKQNYIRKIFNKLKDYYGRPDVPLSHETTEQLAVAVILSAQCTDERVNRTTPVLFARYSDMHALAEAPVKEIEKLVYSTGFYKAKAANISKLARILVEEYNGKIPADFKTLVKLPGIGRKTANVIMNHAFDEAPGIVVDTHINRISQRLGFTQKDGPVHVEKDLMTIWPKDLWGEFPLLIIFHGRKFCDSRRPLCSDCFLNKDCPSADL